MALEPLAAKVPVDQYRTHLQQQQLPPERIDQLMQQVTIEDGFVVAVPSRDLYPKINLIPGLAPKKGGVLDKIGELKAKINERIVEEARNVGRNLGFGPVETKVIPSKKDPDKVTIRTVLKLDSPGAEVEFKGSKGKLLKGGYTVTIDLPYRYQTDESDNIVDVAKQEWPKLQDHLSGAFRAVTFNPERDIKRMPTPGTTVTRHLVVEFKGKYAGEILSADGKAVSQFEVQDRYGEDGEVQLSVKENRLRRIGAAPSFTTNDLRLKGGATVEKQAERGVRLELDLIRDPNFEAQQDADRKLFADTVTFSKSGLPQIIKIDAAKNRDGVRTSRVAKKLDTGADAGYSFGPVGLSAGHDKTLQTVYEARHEDANRKEHDNNLATWIQLTDAKDQAERTKLAGELREAKGVKGAIYHATSRNDDATELAAKFGKTFGTSHVWLLLAAKFGTKLKDCNTIKRTLRISEDGKTSSLNYDAFDGKQFVNTLLDFDAGLKVKPSLKNKIREYTDEIVGHVEDSFSVGSWVENLDLKEKVSDEVYNIIKEDVEKIAISADVTREHGKWGRVILKASGMERGNPLHDAEIAKMIAGDFSGAVALGLPLTTNTVGRKDFKAKVAFDLAGLLSYAMNRSHGVINESKIWEYEGKKYKLTELKGEVDKKVESLNTTNFQVRSYYVTSVGDDGKPLPGVPPQAITTVVYRSTENLVGRDKEAGAIVGMSEALGFDTFVPFDPERADGLGAWFIRNFRQIEPLGGGAIVLASGVSTDGHVAVFKKTQDQGEKIGESVARSILRMGESLTPELAAKTHDLGGVKESERLEIANFINRYFMTDFIASGWNNRIDPKDVDKIRERIEKRINKPPQYNVFYDEDPAEVEAENRRIREEAERIKSILPDGGVDALPDAFVLAAGASALLDVAYDDENGTSRLIYQSSFGRKVDQEKLVREMGQWGRAFTRYIAGDYPLPDYASKEDNATRDMLRTLHQKINAGEIPSDEEVLTAVGKFVEFAWENTQGSTAIFSDDKDLRSLVHWAIVHVMAEQENVIGMARVDADLGEFAAGSSPDMTPAQIEAKRKALEREVTAKKKRLDEEVHGPL